MTDESEHTSEVVICRACMKECEDFKSLYKQGVILGEPTTLATLLSFSIGLDIVPEEEYLPANICMGCVQTLAKTYAFKRMVLEVNDKLRKQYVQNGGQEGKPPPVTADAKSNDEQIKGKVILQCGREGEAIIVGEELKELARAAHIKRSMDDVEYLTLNVVQALDEEGNAQTIVVQEAQDERYDELEELVVHDPETQTLTIVAHEEETDSQDISIEMDEEEEDDGESLEPIDVREEDEEEQELGEDEEDSMLEYVEEMDGGELDPDAEQTERQDTEVDANDDETDKQRARLKRQQKTALLREECPDLKCKECGKQLSSVNSLRYHMQLHSNATPFLCSLCGEGFKTRNAYDGHMVIHDPNNPNTCKICGKGYRQPSSLRAHMVSHTAEKPYRCDICGKGLTQKAGYKKHMLVHTGEKPFMCDICGRDFRYSSNLIAHRRCHSGERPFDCPKCEKCFPTHEQMKRHLVVHTRERPYPCEQCGKCFKRRSSLNSHRHLHETKTVINRRTQEQMPDVLDQKLLKSNVVELY